MPRGGGNRRKGGKKGDGGEETTRIAVISDDKCKPKKCKLECKKNCPVNRQGKICIDVKPTSKLAFISEILCIGCNICVKKCPFDAIQIINLPKNLEASTTHRFGPNSFKLHRLPIPRQNQVLGLVGTNGIGKSTALKVLSNKIKPNLGSFDVCYLLFFPTILAPFFLFFFIVLLFCFSLSISSFFEPLVACCFLHVLNHNVNEKFAIYLSLECILLTYDRHHQIGKIY